MSSIFYGKTLESAVSFAESQGHVRVEREPDLTETILKEVSTKLNQDFSDDTQHCRLLKVRALSFEFRSRYGHPGAIRPVIAAVKHDVLKNRTDVLSGPLPLPSIASHLYDESWIETDTGWQKTRD